MKSLPNRLYIHRVACVEADRVLVSAKSTSFGLAPTVAARKGLAGFAMGCPLVFVGVLEVCLGCSFIFVGKT